MNNQSKFNISTNNELLKDIYNSAEQINSILGEYQNLVNEANSLLEGELTAQLNKCYEAVSNTQKNLSGVFEQYGQTLQRVIESRQSIDTAAGSATQSAVDTAVQGPHFR